MSLLNKVFGNSCNCCENLRIVELEMLKLRNDIDQLNYKDSTNDNSFSRLTKRVFELEAKLEALDPTPESLWKVEKKVDQEDAKGKNGTKSRRKENSQ